MTNVEIQMTKKIQMPKHETTEGCSSLRHSSFGISSTFEFRHSSFRPLLFLAIATGLFGLCGASCPQTLRQYTAPLPRVLPPSPTIEQVVEVVNRNCSQIQSFSTNQASISGSGFPSLWASVAFERQARLRIRAGTGLTGTEFDLGSNDDLFWFWFRRDQPPTLYFCRHDQFASCAARQTLPFEPSWLIEAIGVSGFDPALAHQLTVLPNDRLRVDTIRNTPDGPVKKVTILDGSQGWILEQHVFDPQHKLLGSSYASQHRRDPLSGLVMPKVVTINCPSAQFSMRIDLGNVEINRLSGDPGTLWTMPSYPGVTVVDLATATPQPQAQSQPQGIDRRSVR